MIEVKCSHDAMVSVRDLVPHPENPNRHPEKQIELLSKLIKNHGWRLPITVSNLSGYIIRGHGRYMAAELLGEQSVPVNFQDYENLAKENADLVADNKIAELATLDEEILKNLIKSIKECDADFDFDLTAINEGDILKYLDDNAGLTDENEVPEPKKPMSKLGDLWQLGGHRLLCGDAEKDDFIKILMNGQKADMVFTDPPYNVNYGISKNPRHNIRNIVNDNQSQTKWVEFNLKLVDIFKNYNNGDIYVWGASGPDGMRQRLIFHDNGLHWSATIIWKKQQLVLSPAKYQRIYEPCFYGWNGKNKSSYSGDRKQVEVWEYPRPRHSEEHPTMKPVGLCEIGVQNSSKYKNIVLDIFGGSGSTLLACEKLNRVCYMMEIDPHYCDVIIERWQNFTGQKAKLING